MRVLYLSYDGLTDPLGQSQILPYLKGLSEMGHEIDVISFEKQALFKRSEHAVKVSCRDSGLGYYPQSYTKWPPVLSTLWDIRKMKHHAAKLNRSKNYDIVHCRSYIPALIGSWMQNSFGIKFLFDMRGFYADERVDGNIWPQQNFVFRKVYRYFKQKEKEFLCTADYVISLTHSAKKEILSWSLLPNSNRIAVIPCCVDTAHFTYDQSKEASVAEIRRNLDIQKERLVLGYVGSTGTWYLLKDMMRYFKLVLDKFPDALFLILTYDNEKPIKDTAASIGLNPEKNLRITGVDRKELPHYLSLFNWSVFFIKPVFSKKASSPTKQGELMSMGIPVVCNANVGDSEEIVNNYHSGICIYDTSDKHLKDAVDAIPELLQLDREKIKLGAKQYFSLESGIAKLNQIYAELAQ